jgi:4-amino-4-deoxy-L-arabinose transferase-like glycosyltransferase
VPVLEADSDVAEREPILPSTRKGRWLVLGILVLAFVLRGGYVIASEDWYEPATDAEHFDKIATSIANGDGYGPALLPPATGDSALRAPLYPATLAAVYFVAGDHDWTAGRMVNALLGTVIVALIGLIAAQIWSRRVATVAMALAAIYPTLILIGSGLQLEPLLVTLSLAAVAAALQHRRSPRGLLWPIVCGILLGLAVLTRELGFLLIPSLVWLLWTGTPRWSRRALTAPVVFLVAAFLVVLPWTIRNTLTFEKFVPVSTGAGYGLAGTFNETAMEDGSHPAQWIQPVEDPRMAVVMLERRRPTEVELDDDLRSEVIDVIREHPVYPLKAIVWGTQRLFDLDGGEYSTTVIVAYVPYSKSLTRVSVLASYLVFALAIVGAFLKSARRAPFALWLIPILLYAFIVITLPASIRYRASMEPYFVLLASLTLTAGLDRWERWRRERVGGESAPAPAASSA